MVKWDDHPDPLADLRELANRIKSDIGWSKERQRQQDYEDARVEHFLHLYYGEGPCPCLFCKQRGQGLVEYALILVLVAIIILTILAILGLQVEEMYDMITSRIGLLL